jgi:hypothetical protein
MNTSNDWHHQTQHQVQTRSKEYTDCIPVVTIKHKRYLSARFPILQTHCASSQRRIVPIKNNAKLRRNCLLHRRVPFISTSLRDFARWRTRRWLILRTAIRRLRRLHLDAILLSVVVVALVCAAAAIVSRVAVCLAGAVRRRGLLAVVLVVVVIVGRSSVGVVAGHGARGPAGAVEGLATGFATTPGCEATGVV